MAKSSWSCPRPDCAETAPHLHCRSCPAPVPPEKEYCSPGCSVHGGATKRRVGETFGWFYFRREDGELYRKRLWVETRRLQNPTLVKRPPRGLE